MPQSLDAGTNGLEGIAENEAFRLSDIMAIELGVKGIAEVKGSEPLVQIWRESSRIPRLHWAKKAGEPRECEMRLAASRCSGHASPEVAILHKYARHHHVGYNQFKFVLGLDEMIFITCITLIVPQLYQ